MDREEAFGADTSMAGTFIVDLATGNATTDGTKSLTKSASNTYRRVACLPQAARK
jgi:hypothetical protein